MRIYTDSQDLAEGLLAKEPAGWQPPGTFPSDGIEALARRLFGDRQVLVAETSETHWSNLFVVESAPESQYGILIDLSRSGVPLPDRLLCFAGSGQRFHGFRNRPWLASPGNVHLSARFSPPKVEGDMTIGLLASAAVSVVDAIDAIPGLEARAGIKWVNDVLIDGAKVCGILAHTESMGAQVWAGVVGIGLNVETTPEVEPTPFVPCVASLRDFLPESQPCHQAQAFRELAAALAHNYGQLIEGGYKSVLDRYRERSIVIGHEVAVCREDSGAEPKIVARGRVTGLGERLELFLEGIEKPIDRGRLILDPTV